MARHRFYYVVGGHIYRGYSVIRNPSGYAVVYGRQVLARQMADFAAVRNFIDNYLDGNK